MLFIVVINLSPKQNQEYDGVIRQLSNYFEKIAIPEAEKDQELLSYVFNS